MTGNLNRQRLGLLRESWIWWNLPRNLDLKSSMPFYRAIGILRRPSWLWLARISNKKSHLLQLSTLIMSWNGKRRRDSSTSKKMTLAQSCCLCPAYQWPRKKRKVKRRRKMRLEAKSTSVISWISTSINWRAASRRSLRGCLGGPTRWRKGMRTMPKGLIESVTTWILTVIRTSRSSCTIRNAAQGKSSSARGTSL